MWKEQFSQVVWLIIGYAFLGVAFYVNSPVIFFAGMGIAVVGMIAQPKLAQLWASNYSFLKVPLRSAFNQNTVVEQWRYKGKPTILYGGKESAGALKEMGLANLTIISLLDARVHPKYGKQKFAILAHNGEFFGDVVMHETGEVVALGTYGVSNEKTDILDIWESPYTHPIGLRVYPIHVVSKGGGMGNYIKWWREEFNKVDAMHRRELMPFLRSAV